MGCDGDVLKAAAMGTVALSFTRSVKKRVACARRSVYAFWTAMTGTTVFLRVLFCLALVGVTERAAWAQALTTAPSAWTCVPGITTPIQRRYMGGDIQCASQNGRDCMWNTCSSPTLGMWVPPGNVWSLTCGEDHKAKWGTDGYSMPGHWCEVGCSALGCRARTSPPVVPRLWSEVALYSPAQRRFLRMNPQGIADTAGQIAGPTLPPDWQWERFIVVDAGNGQIALQSKAFGRIIRLNGNLSVDSAAPIADLPNDWQWERFWVFQGGHNTFALYNSAHRRFVRMNPNGTVAASAPTVALSHDWLAERFQLVELGPPLVKNLAFRRPATASSIGWNVTAAGGVDGVKNGGFGFHTQQQPGAWWQVDLGSHATLDRIVLYNRLDCCSERANSITVQLSSDGKQFRTVYANAGKPFFGITGTPLTVPLTGESARWVRLQLVENNALHLDEVEVFGTPGPMDVPPPPAILKLYRDANFSGTMIAVSGDVFNLGDRGFNDDLTSFSLESVGGWGLNAWLALYQHEGYRGRCMNVNAASPRVANMGSTSMGNDEVTSIRWNHRCEQDGSVKLVNRTWTHMGVKLSCAGNQATAVLAIDQSITLQTVRDCSVEFELHDLGGKNYAGAGSGHGYIPANGSTFYIVNLNEADTSYSEKTKYQGREEYGYGVSGKKPWYAIW